jgi:hypothetical protein
MGRMTLRTDVEQREDFAKERVALNLMNAAPELLAALKETLRVLETDPKITTGAAARFAAQRAIAKAEGRCK